MQGLLMAHLAPTKDRSRRSCCLKLHWRHGTGTSMVWYKYDRVDPMNYAVVCHGLRDSLEKTWGPSQEFCDRTVL